MIVFGYAKAVKVLDDGTYRIQTRIPAIHGPFSMNEYQGRKVVNYVRDENLPYYESVILPKTPEDGDVVVISSLAEQTSQFIIIGITGGSYYKGNTIGG